MKMKQKIAIYSIVLLFSVFAFGLYQAWQQKRNPFAANTLIKNPNESRTVLNNQYFSEINIPNEISLLHKKSKKQKYFE